VSKVKKEKMQNTIGQQMEGHGLAQGMTDSPSTERILRGDTSKATAPTFRDAIEALGILAAQCGSAGIRKKNRDKVYMYLCWAALWLCECGVDDDYPTKKEAERLLKGLEGGEGDKRDV
tara:strand:+ start:240 stop:596 length:357 start_codon:yes stop_codon:yes gene_type:complete